MVALYKLALKNMSWMFGINGLSSLGGLLLMTLLVKFLTPLEYGVWSQFKITGILLMGICLLGLDNTFLRFFGDDSHIEKRSNAFFSFLLIGLLASIIIGSLVYLFSDNISQLLTDVGSYSNVFSLMILYLFFSVIYSYLVVFLRAVHRVKNLFYFEFLRLFLELVAIYFLFFYGFSIFEVVLVFIFSRIMVVLLFFVIHKKDFHFKKFDFGSISSDFSYGLPLSIAPFLLWVLQAADQYVIGYFFNAEIVGLYAFAYSLSWLPRIVIHSVNFVLFPNLAKISRQNNDHFNVFFSMSQRIIFFFTIPAIVGLSSLSNEIISLVFSESYLESSFLIPIISSSLLFSAFWVFGMSLLKIEKKTKLILVILLTLSVINVGLNILLVPLYGYVAAAFTTLLTFLISGIIGIIIMRRRKVKIDVVSIVKSLISSALMFIFIYLTRDFVSSILSLLILISISVVIYFVSQFIIKGVTLRDVNLILSMNKRG